MDSRNNPATNDTSAERWRLVLLILCAVGACLVIGILALQVTEYLSYKAPPNVWPQPVAGGTISAPVALSAPLSPVTSTKPFVPPAPVTTTTAPSVSVVSTVVSSAPVVAATSVPAPTTLTALTPAPASTNAPVVAKP